MSKKIAITGASGFIGKHLISELICKGGYEIRVLSRDKQRDLREEQIGSSVEIIEGDLSDLESLKKFLLPDCIVINLVYLRNAGEEANLACMHNLLDACKAINVARLIHCSTADVAGRAANDLIDEKIQCLPTSEYGRTKLKVEQIFINSENKHFDVAILRPTSVFGIGGEGLKKLAADICRGSRWRNYLKSCLFSKRRMNLVHVGNVVAAIIFLIRYAEHLEGEIFYVSDDDDPKNNFIEVERFLMDALGVKQYRVPPLPVPLNLLKALLLLLGRNKVNPHCDFDSSKLQKLGFKNPVSLSEGLAEYAAWYRVTQLDDKSKKAL